MPSGASANSRGDAPTSKPSTTTALRSPPTTASSPSSARSACASSISRAAEHPLVARGERLRDRRRRADHVDDDADARGGFLLGSERDMNMHPDTLAAWTHTALLLPASRPRDGSLVLGVRAADLLRVHDAGAGRAALPGALRQAAGGPEGDRAGASAPSPASAARRGNVVTLTLIGINVAVYVAELAARRQRQRHQQLDLQPRRPVRLGRLHTGASCRSRHTRCCPPDSTRRRRARRMVAAAHALPSCTTARSTSRSTCTRSTSPARSSSR